MKCKNKEIKVQGFAFLSIFNKLKEKELTCIITNDETGKTLSIRDEAIMFSIPFEAIEEYLK